MAAALAFYRRWISPALHSVSGASGACRFQPTCSEYAAVAVARHGAIYGSILALGRLLRCNPFSRGGFDPVPEPAPQGKRSSDLSAARIHSPIYHRTAATKQIRCRELLADLLGSLLGRNTQS